MQNHVDLGRYFINVGNTHVCYMKFDFVCYFTKCEIVYELCNVLVPIFYLLSGIGTYSSQCKIYEV